MPFIRPTPVELRNRIAADLEAALPGADARSRRSIEGVLARMIALASHDLHGYLAWIERQTHVITCDDDMLAENHAPLWGVARKPPSVAVGSVTVSGNAGAVLPAGAELRRADDARYTLDADVTLDNAGAGRGQITALVAGAAGDASVGTRLNLISPVAGISSAVTVADDGSGEGLTGGADLEDVESLRARVLERIQSPPHGGRAADYHAWAMEVPGVTRAWVLPLWMGPGTVGVTFMMDDKADPIPSTEEVELVAAHIDPLRPVTASVAVFAPVPDPINLTISVNPDTTAVRAAISAAVADFFRREAAPGGTLYLSRLSAEISAADDEFRHRLGAPTLDVASAAGHIAVPGTITWTPYA